MKYFLLLLPGLLLFDSLQGSTLPQGRPTRALNTTLRTNFSGIYQRKNPCSGTEVETSSYKASHELHHHTKDDGWCDYTHKCSAIIRNFLQTIGNLIKFNHDPTGSFNFYLNTSISQKQRLTGDPKSCESLPTIVIEATDCKIPINTCCQVPRSENVKYESAEGRKYSTNQFPDYEKPFPPDFSAQEDQSRQEAVLISDTKETISSVPNQPTTHYPGRDWFKAEESSREDDNYKFPSGLSSSAAEDFSPAALYELSRDTKSAYEPKPKIFKTSLKLTPQADPENGTIKPQIHYMAANLVADPSHSESAPQSQTESPFLQPGRSGPLMPVPFPEGPNHPTTSPSPPLEYPPQAPQPSVSSAFQSYASQNEPVQLSVIGQPESQFSLPSSKTETLAGTTAAFHEDPFSTPANLLPLPAHLSNNPSASFTPEDRTAVSSVEPQFSFDPLGSATTGNYGPDISLPQSTPPARQLFDVPSRPTPPNSRSDLTVSSSDQAQPSILQLPRQRPQEDLSSQVSQPAVDFPGQSPKVSGEAPNYPTKLSGPPTFGDPSIESKPQTFIPYFENQLTPPVSRPDKFNAQQITPPHQRFLGQLPYDNRLPSTVLPSRDSFRTHEGISLTTPLPPVQSGSKEVPNYSSLLPGESSEESNGISIPLVSQPSVTPFLARIPPNGLPYSDSLVTSSPGLGGRVEPTDSYLGQQASDGQSTQRFHSSSVTTTVEETVTLDQKQTTPRLVLDATTEQLPESISNNFNPSSPSESDLSSYKASQKFHSVLPNYPQPRLPGPGPLIRNNVEDDNRPSVNPDQLTPEDAENFSTNDSQITNAILSPNNDQVLAAPETSHTIPVPLRQESQLPEPLYDLPTNGLLPMTTPMPFAPNLQKPVLNSPVVPEGKPSFASKSAAVAIYRDLGPTMSPPTQQPYPPGEYNFQVPSQQLHSTPESVPADEPRVGYSDQAGNRVPSASDSFERSDYLTTTASQPLTGNINGITSIPDNSLTYGTASVNQFTDSPQQKRLSVNPESSSPTTGLFGVRSESQITEGVSPYIPSTVTLPPEVYAPLQEQQPLGSTSSQKFQGPLPSSEQFIATDQTSRLSSAVTESPETVLSQEQFESDGNQGRNRLDVYSVTTTDTERDFRRPFQSITPVYATQSPVEADSKRIFEAQTENKYRGRLPKKPLSSLELSDGRQTTDSAMSLQELSSDSFPENRGPSDQYPPAFPLPKTFPRYVDATTPANFPPAAERPNQEFILNRPSAFVSSPPAGEPSSMITPGNLDFQQNSQQFTSFSSQQPSPGFPADTSEPQLSVVPLAELPLSPAPKSQNQNNHFDQAPPVNSIMTTSIKDLAADSLPPTPVDAYAFPLSQDAGTTASPDSPVEYTLPPSFPTKENQFFSSKPLQPNSPVQAFDESIQTTPPQPSDFVLPSSIVSQSRKSDLVLKAPLKTPELSFDRPILFETNTVQPPTSLQVGPALEIIPLPAQPGRTGLQYAEKETTPQLQPQVFDGTSPQPTFDPRSLGSAANLQQTEVFSRREESLQNDFGQGTNNLLVAADSSPLPQRNSFQTTSIEETTATSALNSNQFSTSSTEPPFPEPLQALPESTPAGEIAVIQQQSSPSPDSHQLPNDADRTSGESSSSFDPLVSQQILTPNSQTAATLDRSSAEQAQLLDLTTVNLLPSTTAAPEMALTYPDRPTSYDSRGNVHSVVSDSVESLSSQQESQRGVGPVHFSSIPPPSLNAESQTLSQLDSNFQEQDQRLPETASVVNLQRRQDGPYNLLPPGRLYNELAANSYSGSLPAPLRTPLPDGYPAPNYMRSPQSNSGNRPPFYGQQPVLQTADSQPSPLLLLNSSPKSESTVEQVTESETTSQSSEPQTQPKLAQPGTPFKPEGQLAPASVPPAYLQNPANPNGPMPPLIPNYNAFQSRDRYRYFGPSPLPPNHDPRFRLPNQPNFPPYPLRDQRLVPPPMNQVINDRQIINPRENYPLIRPNFHVQPGREAAFPSEGQTFRQQTEDRLPVDPRSGLPIRPETASRPFDQPPTSPAVGPPPARENDLPNPLLQALQSHLVVPMQEQPQQRSDHNDTENGSQIDNAPASPPYPGRWNPQPATNVVNLQQNTALDSLRGVPNGPQPDPHALGPDQTTPSNEPDPVSTGRSDIMASPLRNSFYADRMRSGSGPQRF